MKNTLLITFILIAFYSAGQDRNKLDSVRTVLLKDRDNAQALLALAQLKQADPDTDYYLSKKVVEIAQSRKDYKSVVIAYNRIGVLYFFSGAYDTALIYFRKAHITSAEHNLHYIAAKTLTNIGQIHLIHDNPKYAVDTLLLARQHLQMTPDLNLRYEQHTKTEYLLGEAYSQVGLYDNAVEILLNLRKLYDENPELTGLGNVFIGLSNAYLAMTDNKNAIAYLHLALKHYEHENDSLNKEKTLYNLGHAYFVKGKLDSAVYWYDSTLSYYSVYKDDMQLPFLYELRANIYRGYNKTDSAFIYYNKAINLYTDFGTDGRVAECYYEMGNLYYNKQVYNKAIPYFQKAEGLYKSVGLVEQLSHTYFLLADALSEIGSYKDAVQYYKLYDSLHDKIMSYEKTNAITRQEILYETSLKEARIAKQKSEITLRKNQNLWLTGGFSFASIALLAIGWGYIRIRKQRTFIARQKKEIIHNNRNSIEQLIIIFGQQAKQAGYQNTAIANQERLFTLQLLNRFLYDTPDTDKLNLNNYLGKLCLAKETSCDIPISLHIAGESLMIDTLLVRDIGLLVNELTTNAIKHAFEEEITNKHISINVWYRNNILNLVCCDNGKGLPDDFDILTVSPSSFGMGYIQDLVEQHSGTIKAYNSNGACFEITLKPNLHV